MWFPSDSWGKVGNTWISYEPTPTKPNRKKNRKLSRQIRNMDKRERERLANAKAILTDVQM
jgi:hypothetical protein